MKDEALALLVYVRDARSPPPSSATASHVMSRNRAKDTGPERALRRALWAAGLRGYRLHPARVPGRPDIAFGAKRVAVFVHGCFWHGCPRHGHAPKSNRGFWREKLARNQARDARKEADLVATGWRVLTFWECEVREDAAGAAAKVAREVS